MQGPLTFKQNNDHFKTVKRELIADGIESHKDKFHHLLKIINMQPSLIHEVALDPSNE